MRRYTNAGFPILTDFGAVYALSINLAIWVPPRMSQMIAGAGWDIPLYHGGGDWILPIPAVFVVDSGSTDDTCAVAEHALSQRIRNVTERGVMRPVEAQAAHEDTGIRHAYEVSSSGAVQMNEIEAIDPGASVQVAASGASVAPVSRGSTDRTTGPARTAPSSRSR